MTTVSEILAEIGRTAKKVSAEKCPQLEAGGFMAMLLLFERLRNLLMTAVVLVAVDLARGAVLLTVDLLTFVGR